MSHYTVIADVDETIVELLRENMADLVSPDSIKVVSPGEIEGGDSVQLSLFLYQITENANMKNQNMVQMGSNRFKQTPVALDLYYMLTSHPSSGIQDKNERTKDEHSVLGRAMQIFSDNSTLKGSILRGGLAADTAELHLTLATLETGDLVNIWSTFQGKPFRPSICYLVTPVMIDSTRERGERRVVERKLERYMGT